MSSAPAPPPRGRPPKGTEHLSRPAIAAAALAVIAERGVAGLTMRAVATRLAADPKSLYNHVDGKDALLDAIAEHVLAGIDIPAPTGDPRADLRAIAHAFRAAALAHPEAATLVLTRQVTAPASLVPVDAVLAVLAGAGLDPARSVLALRALLATLTGTLLREAQAGPRFGTTDTGAIADRALFLELSEHPALARAAAHLARFDGDEVFDFTVTTAIDAVLRRSAPDA